VQMITKTEQIEGTHLIGEVKTTRAELTAILGKPTEYEEGGKVTILWGIKLGSTVATIYDWKRYEEGTPELHEVYLYHIGGRDERALELVKGLLDLGRKAL
jgi:hypothetical protein